MTKGTNRFKSYCDIDTPANQLFQVQDLSKTFINDSPFKLLSR